MLRTFILPALLVTGLLSGGCSFGYILAGERAVDEKAALVNGRPPVFEVVAPASLASVARVAVLDFRDISYREGSMTEVYVDTPLAGHLIWNHDSASLMTTEHFENQLLMSGAVEVVERSRLAMILEEQALQSSGLVAGPLPEMVAGTAGADAVLLGTITAGTIYSPRDPSIRSMIAFSISVRLIDTRDGKILAFGRDSLLRAEHLPDVQDALSALTGRLVNKLAAAIQQARRDHPQAATPTREDYMVPRARHSSDAAPLSVSSPPAEASSVQRASDK